MEKTKKKNIIEKIVILSIALVVLGLLILFFKDIIIPFIKLEIAKDFDGAKEYLMSKGAYGYLMVPIIEALQMVVIFISAEFIQITSGMTYPIWLTLILCDLGVMLGSSIIYFLVNVLRFNGNIFSKESKIQKYERIAKSKSTMVFMYLLFIMPIIPFGAICYYGSSKKMPYFRYLLTCGTGCIPSIITSIVMGRAVREFIANALPIWALILIIVLAAAVLFVLLAFVIHKYFLKKEDVIGNGFLHTFVFNTIKKLSYFVIKVKINNQEKLNDIEGPIIYLANHHCRWDLAAILKLIPIEKTLIVMNEYYYRLPFLGKLARKIGIIGKKMFYPDTSCVLKIMIAIKSGYSVVIFPEGRLSTDGSGSYVDDKIAQLCQKLECNVAVLQLQGNYFISPKWRNKTFRGKCNIDVKHVFKSDDLKTIDSHELGNIIREDLSYNEFSRSDRVYKQRNKAQGLDGILYMCPHCKTYYSNTTKGNTMICNNCGKEYTINPNYFFDDEEIPNLYEYYNKIKQIELEQLDNVNIDVPVDVKIFKDGEKQIREEKGVFHIDNNKVSFKSNISELYFEYTIEQLEGIAYSVNEEFELYYKRELYYFYPINDRQICTRIALVFELLKDKQNGK